MVFLEQVVRMLFVSVQDWVLLYKTSTAVLDLLRGGGREVRQHREGEERGVNRGPLSVSRRLRRSVESDLLWTSSTRRASVRWGGWHTRGRLVRAG